MSIQFCIISTVAYRFFQEVKFGENMMMNKGKNHLKDATLSKEFGGGLILQKKKNLEEKK